MESPERAASAVSLLGQSHRALWDCDLERRHRRPGVLDESYFGWDQSRFAAAWEPNVLRARSQLALARSIRDQLGQDKARFEQYAENR